ncbi:glycerol dehydrogenase [Christensenellaceae bacterium OttesenSCG-928-K19]|nr:glycerol dehydrogenase [Christensenellaceae bacterium OttesenSCG-928-K19]
MKKATNSPMKYVQGKNELDNLCGYAQGLAKQGAYAVVDAFILERYGDQIRQSFEKGAFKLEIAEFGGESSKEEVDRVVAAMKQAGCDVVLGIGGGKTLDTAKAAGYFFECPAIIVPTAASSDAPCSALSVLYHEDGTFDRYLPLRKSPSLVLLDTAVIAAAPVRLLVAGMGDALATYYEARACAASGAQTNAGGVSSLAAGALADACRDTLFKDGYKAMLAVESGQLSTAVENIIEANTYLSGVGFESGGLAAAHAVHDGLTVLPETHKMLHGEKVAFGTLTQLVLENAPDEEIAEVLDFCDSIGLPTTLEALGIKEVTPEKLLPVGEAACAPEDTMRNMPFTVTPEDVVSALIVADKLGDL